MNSLQLVHIIKTQSIKNEFNRFSLVLRENIAITEVNDIKDFEASKFDGSIEWE